jgi:Zn ribbon nucleic-acid-binding protein
MFCSHRYTITDQRASLGDDVIKAIECLKSWAREGLVYWAGSQIHQVECMLSGLEERAAEINRLMGRASHWICISLSFSFS